MPTNQLRRTASGRELGAPAGSVPPDGATELDEAAERAFVADLYAAAATTYDHHLTAECEYRTPLVLAEAVETYLAKDLTTKRGCWLDLGAGTGLLGRTLAGRGLAGPLIGVDVAPEMLAHADSSVYRVRCVADIADAIPLCDGSCAAVLVAGLMEHICDPRPLISEIARVLAPGAALVLTFAPNRANRTEVFEPFSRLRSHDETSFRTWAEDAGLFIFHEFEFDGYRSGRDGWVRQRAVLALADRTDPGRTPNRDGVAGATKTAEMMGDRRALIESILRCPRCGDGRFACARAQSAQSAHRESPPSVFCLRCQTRYSAAEGLIDFRTIHIG